MKTDILAGIEIAEPVKRYSPSGRQGIQIGYNNGWPSQEKMDYLYEDVPVTRSGDKLITEAYYPFKGTITLKEGFQVVEIQHHAMRLSLLCRGTVVEYKKEGRPWNRIFYIGETGRRLSWDFTGYECWRNALTLDAGHIPASLQFYFSCPLLIRSERDGRDFGYVFHLDSTENGTRIPSIHLWL